MQQIIRQYAPEDMGGNGTLEDKDILNETYNPPGTGTAADRSSIGAVGDAPLSDKDKVAPGLSAKLQVASGYFLPDAVNAQNIRNLMKDRNDVAQGKKMGLTVAVGVALLGGWWLLSRSRANSVEKAYGKAKYKTKVGLAKRSAKKALADHVSSPLEPTMNSVKGTVSDAKSATENVVDNVLA